MSGGDDRPASAGATGGTDPASDLTDDRVTDDGGDGDADASGGAESGPRHLHPLTVPYRLVQRGGAVVFFLFFAGTPSMTAMFGPGGALVATGLVVLAGVAVVGYAVAWYRRYEYELTRDTFDIRSGVFSRREREIPLRRIQNVDISQSVVQRALGVAVVSLETAGGGDTEADLRYVGEREADRLQAEVSRLRRTGGEETDEGEAEPEPAETVFDITQRELAVLAAVSADFRVVSLLVFGASLFGPEAYSVVGERLFLGPETLLGAVLGPVAGILAVVAIGLASGLVNAARYYGFVLTRGEDELRYERGLVQQYSGTIPLSKVQTLTIRENVLARWLGYAALNIETAGRVSSGNRSSGSSGSQSAVPIAERERVRRLARSIEPADFGEFERPPKRARQRYAVRYAAALLALAGIAYAVTLPFDVGTYWWLPLAALVLVPVAAHLKWRSRGYALGLDHVVTRNGFWSRSTKVVPYHRVQTTASTETVFQRRRDLGTVIVDTAGARSFGSDDPEAVDVDVATANDLRETVADRLYAALRERRRARRPDGTGRTTASGRSGGDVGADPSGE